MNMVFRLIATCVIFVIFLKYDTYDRVMVTGEMRSYSATIIAAHDAAIPYEVDKSKGYIVFDEGKGTDNFKQSLTKTLKLNSDLSPNDNSIFASPVKIVALFFLGDDKAPTDGSGFPSYPYEYQNNVVYRGQTVSINETIYGPSVVGIIEVSYRVEGSPVTFKTAVYRYKDNSL
ncbi:hypothetical protein [Cohnella sp. AR92]|uniref:hypothetical protein n=1 Tax=Cohnella sp. AR92 TaxID=648716 RepID=UPI000F8C55C5|nr:hypothetical protein [Cohnella sp. AR92]RUS44941.1 hypothetical protein ELR57_22050 [Cohnella sp. AR92]